MNASRRLCLFLMNLHVSSQTHLTHVIQLHGWRQESAPEGCQHCLEDHWLSSSFSEGLAQSSLPQESIQDSPGCIPSRSLTCCPQDNKIKDKQNENKLFLRQSHNCTEESINQTHTRSMDCAIKGNSAITAESECDECGMSVAWHVPFFYYGF